MQVTSKLNESSGDFFYEWCGCGAGHLPGSPLPPRRLPHHVVHTRELLAGQICEVNYSIALSLVVFNTTWFILENFLLDRYAS